MSVQALLRRIGLAPWSEPDDDADQVYSEAMMDDALHNSGKTIERLARMSERGKHTNARLTAGIARLKTAKH
jgi:hypothetical protein